MNSVTAFEKFLEDYVNLNSFRVTRIKDAQRILTDFIAAHPDFKDIFIKVTPQGSYRQKTIIRPIGINGTFDVDLLIILKERNGWSPKEYLAKLAAAFRSSGRYEDITDTKGKTRCVTINYEGDFHVDLVPAIFRNGSFFICNKNTDRFEPSDGDEYAIWFEGQDALTGGHLIPSVRLLKFLRDSGDDFNTKSIILTTIAGNQVSSGKDYSSLPVTFYNILTGMHTYLSQFTEPPSVINPSMPGENFNRHWKNDVTGFTNLKAAIKRYAEVADQAIHAQSDEEAVKQWRKLFGEKFGVIGEQTPSGTGTIYTPSPNTFQPPRNWCLHDNHR